MSIIRLKGKVSVCVTAADMRLRPLRPAELSPERNRAALLTRDARCQTACGACLAPGHDSRPHIRPARPALWRPARELAPYVGDPPALSPTRWPSLQPDTPCHNSRPRFTDLHPAQSETRPMRGPGLQRPGTAEDEPGLNPQLGTCLQHRQYLAPRGTAPTGGLPISDGVFCAKAQRPDTDG